VSAPKCAGFDDLKAAIAFYESPTGQRLLLAQPQLAKAKLNALAQWMQEVKPEMQKRIAETMKVPGWGSN
jgi:hypothetical protein